jgi:hypothetical protein
VIARRLEALAANRRAIALLATGAIAAGAILYLVVLGPPPPPGFIRDEASVSYNAYAISRNLHDQNGGLLPLYIKSFGDYKSSLFVYVLAVVFRVTGPSKAAAIGTAGSIVAAAVLLVGLLAWRRTRSFFVASATIAVAAVTPWLYDLGRVVFDTTIEPLLVVLVLLAVDWAYRSERHPLLRALPVALALAGLSYSYAGGRLVSPLWAAALLIFAGRGRWRWLLSTWGLYAVAMLPLAVYSFAHSGALGARYKDVTFISSGMSIGSIVGHFLGNYLRDANPWHWVTSGDPRPYIHVAGSPQLLATTAMLALAGVVLILRRERQDRFWWFVGAALLLSPAADAITTQRDYSLRLLPLPILLTALGLPALDALRRSVTRDWTARLVGVGLALLVVPQVAQYRSNYAARNHGRAVLYEDQVPVLLQRAFAGNATVYIDHDDVYAQTHALWYAVSHGLPSSRVSILPDGGIPPLGSMVFGRLQACDYTCPHIADAETYWIARAAGPKPVDG